MKKLMIILTSFFWLAAITGCQNTKSRAVEGAVIGGVIGATAGGIIGHQSHHGAEGAGIGAAAGALGGALIGSQMEKNQPATQAASPSQTTNVNQMTIEQIVDLSKQGVNEEVIIDRIRMTNSKFNLEPAQIDYLQQQGVSQKVIDEMNQ